MLHFAQNLNRRPAKLSDENIFQYPTSPTDEVLLMKVLRKKHFYMFLMNGKKVSQPKSNLNL